MSVMPIPMSQTVCLDCVKPFEIQNRLYQYERRLNNLTPRLMQRSPDRRITQASHQLQQLQGRLTQTMQQQLHSAQNTLAMQASRLESVSTLNVLARGYSITKNEQGQVIKSINQVTQGDLIVTELADGVIQARVS